MTKIVAGCDVVEQAGPELQPWGRHALADCRGVEFILLNNLHFLERTIRRSILCAGANLLGIDSRQFDPFGVTVCAILAESHVTIHTYPEHGVAMLDAFTCGQVDPTEIVSPIITALRPRHHQVSLMERGYRSIP